MKRITAQKNLYFCLKTSTFVTKFPADDRDTQRENGKRYILGGDEQHHPAISRRGVWHHAGSYPVRRRLWHDGDDSHFPVGCHCPSKQWVHGSYYQYEIPYPR